MDVVFGNSHLAQKCTRGGEHFARAAEIERNIAEIADDPREVTASMRPRVGPARRVGPRQRERDMEPGELPLQGFNFPTENDVGLCLVGVDKIDLAGPILIVR